MGLLEYRPQVACVPVTQPTSWAALSQSSCEQSVFCDVLDLYLPLLPERYLCAEGGTEHGLGHASCSLTRRLGHQVRLHCVQYATTREPIIYEVHRSPIGHKDMGDAHLNDVVRGVLLLVSQT